MTKNFFESKIKPLLIYVGTFGAILTSIAYVCICTILIFGFSAHNVVQTLLFAVINGLVGFIIMQFLKVQGESFGKNIPENKALLDEYYNTKTKDKKIHSLTYYWITSVIKDILFKAVSITITTAGMIYIIIEGSEDYLLLLLAFVNLLMFFCFGLLSLNKAYDFTCNEHMFYIKTKLAEYKEEQEELKALDEVLDEDSTNNCPGIRNNSGDSNNEISQQKEIIE